MARTMSDTMFARVVQINRDALSAYNDTCTVEDFARWCRAGTVTEWATFRALYLDYLACCADLCRQALAPHAVQRQWSSIGGERSVSRQRTSYCVPRRQAVPSRPAAAARRPERRAA